MLAGTVGRLAEPGWRRLSATWLVLAFATVGPITMWNRSLLSESLSMSLLALVVAGLMAVARRVTWPRVVGTVAAGLAFATTRDAQAWTVAAARGGARRAGPRPDLAGPDRRGAAGVLAVCLIAAAGLAEWGTLASDRTTGDVADVFYVRVFPFPARVAWFAAHGMPEARQIDGLAAATTATGGAAKVVALGTNQPSLVPLQRWLRTDGGAAYLEWLATHPWYVVTEPLVRPERAFNFARGNLGFYAGPGGPPTSPLTPIFWSGLPVLALLAAAAASLAVRRRAWLHPPWRVLVAVTGVGVVAMLVAWHGDGQEVTRHTVEGLAEVHVGIVILVVIGLLGRWPPPAAASPARSSVVAHRTRRTKVHTGSTASSASRMVPDHHQYGPATVSATRIQSRARTGRATAPPRPPVRSGGTSTTHTQWWLHEIGLTSRPTNATATTAKASRRVRAHRQAMSVPAATVSADRTSQVGVDPPEGNGGRWSTAFHDWLLGSVTFPIRAVSPTSWYQNVRDSDGQSNQASPVHTANEARARTVEAQSRRVRRTRRKTSGVNLTAEAMPRSTPRNGAGTTNRSATTTNIKRSSICP